LARGIAKSFQELGKQLWPAKKATFLDNFGRNVPGVAANLRVLILECDGDSELDKLKAIGGNCLPIASQIVLEHDSSGGPYEVVVLLRKLYTIGGLRARENIGEIVVDIGRAFGLMQHL
jgi:hypothetical protein